MTINFYQYSGDPRQVDKTNGLTPTASIDAQIYGDNVLQSPNIKTEYNTAILNSNYMYIPDFGRWYYCYPTQLNNGAHLTITGAVDLKMTAKNDVLNSTGLVRRSNNGNKYMIDPLGATTERTTFQYRNLGTCFTPAVTYCIVKGR